MVLRICGHLTLLHQVSLRFVSLQLGEVVRLEQRSKVVIRVVVYRLFNFVLHSWRHHGNNEVIKCFEDVSLFLRIKIEEAIAVLTIQNHLLTRTAAEFQYFQQLVVIVLAREYRYFNEHFDGCAGQGPHVDALIVQGHCMSI